MEYQYSSHSKYLLLAHVIFVVKYRKKLLVKCGEDIKIIFNDIAVKNNIQIIEMEVDKDHIHFLIKYPPQIALSILIEKFKMISTYRIWRIEGYKIYLQKHFWKEKTFWSDGYFICSIGNISLETIQHYIQTQG